MSPAVTVVFAAISALGGITGVVAWRRVRSQNRLDDAQADEKEAGAALDWQSVYQKAIEDQDKVIEALRDEMRGLRDDARAAKASAEAARAEAAHANLARAEAETKFADARAELTVAIKDAGDERHAMQNDIRALKLALEAKDIEIAELNDQLATLRARLGPTERRQQQDRRDDITA